MLHRAADNAYSWWWASHIRTKQSRWLEENLQVVEEKVSSMLKIAEQKGDSFTQRVEMFYKKRPELVNHVEETYRSYRALAERYDRLSRDMQSANRTIAVVFPEQVQYSMDSDDDDFAPTIPTPSTPLLSPDKDPNLPKPNIPKVPTMPKNELWSPTTKFAKKGEQYKPFNPSAKAAEPPISGLSKEEALEEIDKIQKEILALQTEKEFMQSICKRCNERSSGIESQINGMQARASSLQDEFGISNFLNDNEARTLMAATALKSCQDNLIRLQERKEQTTKEIKVESKKVKDIINKFMTLQTGKKVSIDEQETEIDEAARQNSELLKEKIKKELEADLKSMTVIGIAERINELVDMVVGFETKVTSQDAMVNVLRSEADGLQEHIKTLEEVNKILKEDSEQKSIRLKELEEELSRVKSLNESLRDQNAKLEANFTEASCNIDHLSEKLKNVKPDEEVKNEAEAEAEAEGEIKDIEAAKEQSLEDVMPENDLEQEKEGEKELSLKGFNLDKQPEELGSDDDEDKISWRIPIIGAQGDTEKLLLEECIHVVKIHKDLRKKLNEVEKQNRDGFFELAMQIRELKNTIALKDEEIESLRKMNSLPSDKDENQDANLTKYKYIDRQGGSPESIVHTASLQDSNISTPNSPQHQIFSPAKMKIDEIVMKAVSAIEEKFRQDIDKVLEENLEFWLRFSTSVHQIQKFQNVIQDLKIELARLKDRQDESDTTKVSECRAIYKHLRQIQTELTFWSENSSVLRDELQSRYASLCSIQEELTKVSNSASEEEEAELSKYQAAKFQGEILNMKQENNKVTEELQAGLVRVSLLKDDVEKTIAKLDEELGKPQRVRIPLRSFLFGAKLKKHKQNMQCFLPRSLSGFKDQRTDIPAAKH